MHPQRTLIESALNVYLNEAKEGDLFRFLRSGISKEYGIPHDQIGNAPTVE